MRIIWTEKTEKQLDQIFEYIATDSSLYAYRKVGQIIEVAENLPPHPRKGRKVPEYEFLKQNFKYCFTHSLIWL